MVSPVALTEDGEIIGTVTDQQTVTPISGATVTCGGCPTPTTTTDASGNFAFVDVPNGAAYVVTFSAAGYVTQTITGVAVTGPNDTDERRSARRGLGGVSGTVVAAGSLTPIQNATVTCTCETGSVATDPTGAYVFTQAAPGAAYTVSVTATGFAGQTSAPFAVNAGAMSTVNVQLAPIPTGLKVVQTFGAANAGSAGTVSLTAGTGTATGPGDLLVVTVRDRSSPLTTVSGISDSSLGLNTWQKATGIENSQGDEEIWYAANAAGVTSITVTVTGTASLAMTAVDISGAATNPLDRTMTKRGSGGAASTGTTATTSQADEIVVGRHRMERRSDAQQADCRVHPGSEPAVQGLEYSDRRTGGVAASQRHWSRDLCGHLSSSVPWLGAIATFK